ncbi:uncharacterized protein LOC131064629 isoform X2 [Cryptomeria japonica]|uniref:uncharacterized protein LOC131064629 isoform X2 n=1 Tax=Cryptomeria japonica TaxID=3369 RepID=UPI0025AB770C|nr:uncharacterized protein LOC131064629 isoform X2 [Cryptomeria japonica]
MAVTSTVARSPAFHAPTFHTNQYSHRCRGSVSRRMRLKMSAAASGVTSVQTKPLTLTYLEANGWLWEVNGVRIIVDPILVGNLDFGVPWLFDGAKKTLKNFRLENLEELDCLLITQSLDDHCHKKTLDALSNIYQDLHVVSTPNAKPILETLFKEVWFCLSGEIGISNLMVTYIEPGQTTQLKGRNSSEIIIRASAGPVLGPPWQRPENGYFIQAQDPKFTLYYEPHCVYNKFLLEEEYADVVITPVIKQLLPAFTLVSGQEDAVELARLLKARYVVPMNNGELETKGLLSSILYADGTIDSFKALLSNALPHVQILEPSPGSPLDIPIPL